MDARATFLLRKLKKESQRTNKYSSLWPCIMVNETMPGKFEIVRGYRHSDKWYETYFWLRDKDGNEYDICNGFNINGIKSDLIVSKTMPSGRDASVKDDNTTYEQYMKLGISWAVNTAPYEVSRILHSLLH